MNWNQNTAKFYVCVVFCITLLGFNAPGQADRQLVREKPATKRHALIIGNSTFAGATISSAVSDAKSVAEALAVAGFEVVLKTDVSQPEMKRAIDDFGKSLREQGGIGLFYFAGYGVQHRSKNYLVPVGALIDVAEDIEYEGVEVRRVLSRMQAAGNSANVVILDASRDFPIAASSRSFSKGLVTIDAPDRTFVAMSSAPGTVSVPVEGESGLYAQELVSQIRTPGVEIEEAFKKIRVAVSEKTESRQITWESSSLTAEVFLSGGTATGAKKPSVAVTAPKPEPPKISEKEQAAWDLVKDSSDLSVLQIYLDEFPDGAYSSVARIKIRKVEREEWDTVKETDDPAVLRGYLDKFPKGDFAPTARILLRQKEKDAWLDVRDSSDILEIQRFLADFPDSENGAAAKIRIRQIENDEWAKIDKSNDRSAIQAYISTYPESENVTAAENRLREIEREEWESARDSRSTEQLEAYLSAYPDGEFSSSASALIEEIRAEPAPEKKESTFGKFLSGILKAAQVNCRPGVNQIAVFTDSNYRGQCVVKGVGRYSNPRAIGIANDSISSILVGSNVRAALCQHDNFRGRCETISQNDTSLRNNGIGDNQVSSLVVANRPRGSSRTSSSLRPPARGYTYCAKEWGKCKVPSRGTVAYGANGRFKYKRNVSGTINCNNATFGDPAPGAPKACYYMARTMSTARTCTPNANQVALFFDVNYRGRCVIRNIGNYSTSASIGLPDNSLSSVSVGRNVRVVLCRNRNFRGPCETLSASDSSLVNNRIGNDQVSSIRVIRKAQ